MTHEEFCVLLAKRSGVSLQRAEQIEIALHAAFKVHDKDSKRAAARAIPMRSAIGVSDFWAAALANFASVRRR